MTSVKHYLFMVISLPYRFKGLFLGLGYSKNPNKHDAARCITKRRLKDETTSACYLNEN